jgi:hypothetical protein
MMNRNRFSHYTRMYFLKVTAVLAVMLLSALIVSCQRNPTANKSPTATPTGEGFAFYLTAKEVPVEQMKNLNHVSLSSEPLISIDDIVSYDWGTHEITLVDDWWQVIQNTETPIGNRSFIVCVDKQPIYWGQFYFSFQSSFAPTGIPFITDIIPVQNGSLGLVSAGSKIIKIELYPDDGDSDTLTDPRTNVVIKEALERDGKLVTGEGFAIYLTAQDIPIQQMEALSHVELADTPLISAADIVSYNWNTHKITLSETGNEKLKSFEVPISGKVFLICVDKAPVYWGAFYNPLSSYFPFGKPIIYAFPMLWESLEIKWEAMSGDSETISDPRSDPRILESLRQWNKLELY